MLRTCFVLLLLGIPAAFAEEAVLVGAPPFRELGRRLDLDFFSDRLRDQLMVGHPDMSSFRFTHEDAGAFVFYLRSLQVP
jgi:hypothetical protein